VRTLILIWVSLFCTACASSAVAAGSRTALPVPPAVAVVAVGDGEVILEIAELI
jgi:hypothetical protein